MEPKERWEQEREEGKKQREMSIISSAERVFARKGLDKATMKDIANEDNIGIATVFRYFPKKDKLIIAVASGIIALELKAFRTIADSKASGIDKIEMLFDHFISHHSHDFSNRSKILEAFESYAAQQAEPLDDIQTYNAVHHQVLEIFNEIIESSVQDQTIRSDISIRDTLSTLVNAFGIVNKKLSLRSNTPLLEVDIDAPAHQMSILKHIFMEYLKPRK